MRGGANFDKLMPPLTCRLRRHPLPVNGERKEPARFVVATPAEASGLCCRWEAGRRPKPLNYLYVARFPAPRRRSCLGGGHGRCRWSPSRPGPGGSSPSRATVARPIRRRRPPQSPVPDLGSREGDGRIMREGWRAWRDGRELFFAIERNQWDGRDVYPRGYRRARPSPVCYAGTSPPKAAESHMVGKLGQSACLLGRHCRLVPRICGRRRNGDMPKPRTVPTRSRSRSSGQARG
jgi:hypothetical protein